MVLRIFSYRNKHFAKIFLLILATAALLFAMFVVCRFIYLQRFLIYTETGVELNYEQEYL